MKKVVAIIEVKYRNYTENEIVYQGKEAEMLEVLSGEDVKEWEVVEGEYELAQYQLENIAKNFNAANVSETGAKTTNSRKVKASIRRLNVAYAWFYMGEALGKKKELDYDTKKLIDFAQDKQFDAFDIAFDYLIENPTLQNDVSDNGGSWDMYEDHLA